MPPPTSRRSADAPRWRHAWGATVLDGGWLRPCRAASVARHDTLKYRGLTACTPNESEVEQLLGLTIDDRVDVLERAGRAVLRRTGMEAVLITRGGRGMALFQRDAPTEHIAIFGSDEIA